MKKIKYLFLFLLSYFIIYYCLKNSIKKLLNFQYLLFKENLNYQIDNNINPITVYYAANNHLNAGDYFGKWVLEKMGFKVVFSKKPELIVCGSILAFNSRISNNTKVWGVGFHYYKQSTIIKDPNLFYAVRGKLTLNRLNLKSNIALGDPGLLLSLFYKPISKKLFDICIVSHSVDYKWFIKNYNDKYFIISMNNNNIEELANLIYKCKFIFSSSLHGIIFSHSLGIPAVHLEHKMLISKKNFKFKDYYSVLDIPYIKEDLKKENLDDIVKKYENNRFKYLPSKKKIRQIQDSLSSSFPYQKMNYVICTFSENENKNINNWCNYYLNLGFDNIYLYLYDNSNYNTTYYIGDYIDDKIKKRVHIININNKNNKEYIHNSYITFYNLFKLNFKWCAFIDISVFISLGKWNNISQLLNDPIFKNASIIKFKWNINEKSYLIDSSDKIPMKRALKNKIANIMIKSQERSI